MRVVFYGSVLRAVHSGCVNARLTDTLRCALYTKRHRARGGRCVRYPLAALYIADPQVSHAVCMERGQARRAANMDGIKTESVYAVHGGVG